MPTPSTAPNAAPLADCEITIQGITFRAPVRYATGHICSEIEADQLNSTLHDNLRNNFSKYMKGFLEKRQPGVATEDLNPFEIDVLRKKFAEYAAAYVFTSVRRGPSADPVERTCRALARDLLAERLRRAGRKVDDLPDAEYERLIAELAANSRVREEAQRRVDAARNIALEALTLDTAAPHA